MRRRQCDMAALTISSFGAAAFFHSCAALVLFPASSASRACLAKLFWSVRRAVCVASFGG